MYDITALAHHVELVDDDTADGAQLLLLHEAVDQHVCLLECADDDTHLGAHLQSQGRAVDQLAEKWVRTSVPISNQPLQLTRTSARWLIGP